MSTRAIFEGGGSLLSPIKGGRGRRPPTTEPVCDQDSVMEFGLDQLRTGLRPGSSRSELSRHVEIARTCLSLVADCSKPNSITLSGRRQVRSWSQTC